MCLSAVGRGFLRVFGGLTNLLSKIRSKSKLYGIHIPLVLFSTLLLAIYVPFVAIPFTFTYNLWYKLVFGSVLHVIAILVISSLFYTILEPYPEHPQHLKVEDDFFYWEKDEKSLYVVEKCDEIGANLRHITAVCGTCGIIKTERAHHCSLCNVCTPRLDHHCVVLDRCIHYGNQKSFILFFFYMLFFIFTYAIANAGLMLYFRNVAIEGHPGHEYNLMLLLGAWISLTSPIYNSYLMIYFGLAHILMGCVALIFTVIFPLYIYYAVYSNCTIAACNTAVAFKSTFPYAGMNPTNQSCFKKNSVKENFEVIFGEFGWKWLVPGKTNQGEGWVHECSCEKSIALDEKVIKVKTGEFTDGETTSTESSINSFSA